MDPGRDHSDHGPDKIVVQEAQAAIPPGSVPSPYSHTGGGASLTTG